MIACFCLYGGTMGIGYNVQGVFNAAISKEMGWKISSFTLYTVFLGIASALTSMLATDRIFRKYDMRKVLSVSVIVYAATLCLRALCTQLWQFCVLYIFNGIAAAFLFYVPVPLLINNWFHKRGGFALGLSVLSSGIFGAIMNVVLSAIIEAKGWQTAAVVNGLAALIVALPATILIVRKTPKEKGLLPYGEGEGEQEPEAVLQTEEAPVRRIPSAVRRRCFAFSWVLAIIVLVVSMIPQQLAHVAQTAGLDPAIGASLVSVGMVGNMTSKAIMGFCVDRFGKKATFTASFLLVAVGFLVYAVIPGAPLIILYAAAFLTGISAANNVVVMPFMVRVYSDGDAYLNYMSRVTVATMVATAFGTYICSAIYDFAGSYTWEFLIFIAADLIGLALVWGILAAEKPNGDGV